MVITPSPDGRSCHCVFLLRTNLMGQLPGMVVQAALAAQSLAVVSITKVRGVAVCVCVCVRELIEFVFVWVCCFACPLQQLAKKYPAGPPLESYAPVTNPCAPPVPAHPAPAETGAPHSTRT